MGVDGCCCKGPFTIDAVMPLGNSMLEEEHHPNQVQRQSDLDCQGRMQGV